MSKEEKAIVLYRDRIVPLLDVYDDDALGRIIRAYLNYALDGEIIELKNKHENADLKQLRGMHDIITYGHKKKQVTQIINSALRYAESSEDMKRRLELKGLDEIDVQDGVDRYFDKLKRQGVDGYINRAIGKSR